MEQLSIKKDPEQCPTFVNLFTMVDVDGDGNITADEFKAACGKGLVKNTNRTVTTGFYPCSEGASDFGRRPFCSMLSRDGTPAGAL